MKFFENILGMDCKSTATDACGTYRGFATNCTLGANQAVLDTRIVFAAGEGVGDALKSALNSLNVSLTSYYKKVSRCTVTDNSFFFEIKRPRKNKKTAQMTVEILDKIIDVLNSYGCYACCENCFEPVATSWYKFDNTSVCVCPDCFNKLAADIERADNEAASVPINYVTGTIGAIIGACIASAIYTLFLLGDRIVLSVWLPLLTFGGFLFGGKRLGKLGSIISTVVCLVVFYFGLRFGMSVAISKDFDIPVMEVFSQLSELKDTTYYKQVMIEGYGISAIASIVIGGISFFDKGKTKISKM